MASTREVEIKFLVHDIEALRRALRRAGFREVTPETHEMNTLYDLPDQALRERGELLRVRKYGDDWILTHKAKSVNKRHKSRVETETQVADGRKLDSILRSLGFAPSFIYEKFRAEWSDGKGHVLIDRTPIGDVAEIEGPARWIDRTAKSLGISPREYITANYAQMFMDWKQRSNSTAEHMTFKTVRNSRAKQSRRG